MHEEELPFKVVRTNGHDEVSRAQRQPHHGEGCIRDGREAISQGYHPLPQRRADHC
jgi:hypothetical protein